MTSSTSDAGVLSNKLTTAPHSPYGFSYAFVEPKKTSTSRRKQLIVDDSSRRNGLLEVVEGTLSQTSLKRLSARERGMLQSRVRSIRALASVPYISSSAVMERVSALLPLLSPHPMKAGETSLDVLTNAGDAIGRYIMWLGSIPHTDHEATPPLRHLHLRPANRPNVSEAYCYVRRCGGSAGAGMTPSSALGEDGGLGGTAAEIVFGAVLAVRAAVYTFGYRAAGRHENASSIISMLLSCVFSSIECASCPLIRPTLMLSRVEGRDTPSSIRAQLGKAHAEALKTRAWFKLRGVASAPPEVRAWLSAVQSVLYSFEDRVVDSNDSRGDQFPTPTPLAVTQVLSSRGFSCWASYGRVASLIRLGCDADLMSYSHQWATVGDTYMKLVAASASVRRGKGAEEGRSYYSRDESHAIHVKLRKGDGADVHSSLEEEDETILCVLPSVIHQRVCRTLCIYAPIQYLNRVLEALRLGEDTGDLSVSGVPPLVRGHFALAAASARVSWDGSRCGGGVGGGLLMHSSQSTCAHGHEGFIL